MSSTSKAAKLSGDASPESSGEDRLSALPEGLRLHVLTLLPLRSAIRTGLLSSAWRDLWRHRWPYPSSLDISSPPMPCSDLDAFATSIDDLVLRRGRRPLDSLSISLRPSACHLAAIHRWIAYAAECSVTVLRVDLSPLPPPELRKSLRRGHQRPILFAFACDAPSLVSLSLSGFRLASPVRFKPLRNLEYLSLHSLRLSEAAFRRIVSALPLLRSLDLRRCPGLKAIVVSCLRLASLTVVDCSKVSEIVVTAPNLSSFRFRGEFLEKHVFKGVWIPLDELYLNSGGTGIGLPSSDWVGAFGGIVANLRVLTLCSVALQYLANSPLGLIRDFANLRNLRELQLLMLVLADGDLTDLYRFFKNCQCPRLERLFIELPEHMGDPFMEKHLDVAEEVPPEGGFEHLKLIKFCNFKGHWNEMRLLKFLLEKSPLLESMVIISPVDLLEEKFAHFVSDDLPNVLAVLGACLWSIPKASASAKIILSGYDDMLLRPSQEFL